MICQKRQSQFAARIPSAVGLEIHGPKCAPGRVLNENHVMAAIPRVISGWTAKWRAPTPTALTADTLHDISSIML
jgi:hypothetical protein